MSTIRKKIYLTVFSICVFSLFIAPKPADAQIASANLNHVKSFFFNQEVVNPYSQSNYTMFPQSTYVLSPQTSGWRKSGSLFLSYDYYAATPKTTTETNGVNATLADGTDESTSINMGSSFIVGKNYYVDINVKSGNIAFEPSKSSPKTTLERTTTGFNVNLGSRIFQVLSLGVGIAQVNNDITYNTNNVKTVLSQVEQTYSLGVSLRLGNFFLGGGADIEVSESGTIKIGSAKQVEMLANRYGKFYGGIGLSMGHPRDAELHVEIDYISIPKSDAINGKESVSFVRQAYTELSLSSEFIYYDFYFSIAFKQGTIEGTKDGDYTSKNASFSKSQIGMGYMPAKNIFFNIGGGSTGATSESSLNSVTTKIASTGTSAFVGMGISF